MKMSLCPMCTHCPEVEVTGDEVRRGHDEVRQDDGRERPVGGSFLDTPDDRRLDCHNMRAGRFSSWFLIVLGAVMVLTHVCAEPLHAHAGTITAHEGHDTHDGADETGHD